MPTCPECGKFVSARAVVCRYCKTLLMDATIYAVPAAEEADDATVRVLMFPEERIAKSDRRPTLDDTATASAVSGRLDLLEPLNANEIALLIEGDPVPLVITVNESVVVGRYSEHSHEQPHLDLVPYGAFDKGVSRFHAQIMRVEDQLEVVDLASSNGTWLNGKRLLARQPSTLDSGDYLRFGFMRLQVHFKAKTQAENVTPTP